MDAVAPPRAHFSYNRWAVRTFVVLFAMNLLDYTDRWALSGVLPMIQEEMGLNDAAGGSLNMYFLISYAVFSPFMGYAGDRLRRTRLLALGVGLWSLATVGTALAQDFLHLRIARSMLGIGEATYGVLAPSILMDLFPRERRSRVLAAFYMAMPVGYALGVKLGGSIAVATGSWRMAFFVVGVPGLVAAVAALFLPEPVRGASEGVDAERLRDHERAGSTWDDYRDLMVNSSYTYTVFGLSAYTFAFGGLAYWLPSFLVRVKNLPKHQADNIVALTGLVATIVGMWGGGWVADRLMRRTPKALFLVSGVSMMLAIPCIIIALFSNSALAITIWMFLAMLFLFANTGPSNAVIANVIMPNQRATAYAVSTFAIHFLGDVWSPMLMGAVSDFCGKPSTMATGLGRLLESVGFVAIDGKNLGAGMLVVVPAVFLGGLVLLAGMRHLPREMALMLARLKAAPAQGPQAIPPSTV